MPSRCESEQSAGPRKPRRTVTEWRITFSFFGVGGPFRTRPTGKNSSFSGPTKRHDDLFLPDSSQSGFPVARHSFKRADPTDRGPGRRPGHRDPDHGPVTRCAVNEGRVFTRKLARSGATCLGPRNGAACVTADVGYRVRRRYNDLYGQQFILQSIPIRRTRDAGDASSAITSEIIIEPLTCLTLTFSAS